MIKNVTPRITLKLATTLLASLAGLTLSSCSSSKPTSPPVVTQVSPGQASEGSGFGAGMVVDSKVAKATVVSIDTEGKKIVLKRPDGRLATCKARPGVVAFTDIKVGDEVVIAIGEERALALGKTSLPDSGPSSEHIQARVPAGMVAMAEAMETVAFTAKIVTIDQWDSMVTLRMADGTLKPVRTGVAVNLANFNPGDEVSARITEVLVLIVKSEPAK